MMKTPTSLICSAALITVFMGCSSEGTDPIGDSTGGSPGSGGSALGSSGGASGGQGNASGGDSSAEPAGGSSSGGAMSSGGTASGGGNSSGGAANNGEPTPAQLAAAAMGRGFNLGQLFESTQHARTLQTATAKIDAYYARGFRNVRIPVTWTEAIGGDLLVGDPMVGDVKRDHPRLQVIASVVDYALSKEGLYVVLNTHHEAGLKTNSRAQVLQRLWQDIADIFADRSHHLLFEILNEPHRDDGEPMPADDLRQMTGLAYNKIRAVDPERLVIFGGNQWFGAHEVPAVWTSLEEVGSGMDPYLMVTFHHYDPWTFCGDNQDTYDDPWTDAHQSAPMKLMQDWAQSVGNGMPVYIGEWGVGWGSRYSQLSCNNIRQWYTSFDSQFARSFGQPTAVWDDGGWFKIFDHGSNSFGNNLIDCLVGDCAWDGTERYNDGCL